MKKIEKHQVYSTIIVLAAALLVIGFVFHVHYLDWAALALLLLSVFIYFIAYWIAWAWLKFAVIIGGINSKILLSLIFFLFLFPISVLYRLSKKDPLKLKKKESPQDSYYTSRNHPVSAEDFTKTF